MAVSHVRARCKTTGAIAAISEAALDAGHFPDWVRTDGPTPKRPKPAVFHKTVKPTDADSKSANEEKE